MSARPARPSDAAASAASRDRSLLRLLDPNDFMPGHTTADLYSLRHLTLRGGLPDSPSWVRAQAWKVLLGYLPPEKREWSAALAKRRREYYQFLNDFAPTLNSLDCQETMSDKDAMLDQIYKDLSRSRKNGFAFYQAVSKSSSSCPISPLPKQMAHDAGTHSATTTSVQRLENRHHTLRRLALINRDFVQTLHAERRSAVGSRGRGARPPQVLHSENTSFAEEDNVGHDVSLASMSETSIISPPILLSPPSPGAMSRSSSQHSFASAHDVLDEDSLTSFAGRMTLQDTATSPISSEQSRIPELQDRNWHSLLRILYLFALLNPSIGYVQGMNEALFTLVYIFGTAKYPSQDRLHPSHSASSNLDSVLDPNDSNDTDSALRNWDNDVDLADLNSHAEADAFWCFSTLIAEVRELYEFEELSRSSVPTSQSTGMAGTLAKFSLRLKWLDREFWADLRSYNMDPLLPYYSVRWLACLLSTELSFPSVTRVWDALLAEQEQGSSPTSAKIDFLIDVSCAMLLNVKHRLPSSPEGIEEEREAFSYGMRFLQSYPDDDISPVLELATLFRQRRLAADLTGDGPPVRDDEEDDFASEHTSVKARATKVFRNWANSTSSTHESSYPQPGTSSTGRWLGSFGLTGATTVDSETADVSVSSSNAEDASTKFTPSKASFGELFAKYADAVQRSDAAANLSKTSTNLTAKALVRFGDRSSRESTPETVPPVANVLSRSHGSRIASLGSVSAGIFSRNRRTVSSNTSASAGPDSPRTPEANKWAEEAAPDFPLPNVSDSPAGRMEYVDTSGKRISSINGARSHQASASSGVDGQCESLKTLPLPSMRAAAKLGILSRQRELSNSPSNRIGPKPLLLSQSARPPREASSGSASSLLLSEEPSRKVSSGPMAQGMSRGNSQQDGRSSIAESFSGRSSRSVSNAGSRRSSIGSPDSSMAGLHHAGELPPLPSLMAQNSEALRLYPTDPGKEEEHAAPRKYSTGSIGLQGLASTEGMAPAGAFGRTSKAMGTSNAEVVRPAFGQVSSSSDIPLIAAGSTKISRPRLHNRKRTSGSTIDSRSASISESVIENRLSNRYSLTTSAVDPGLNGWSEDRDINILSTTPPELQALDTALHSSSYTLRPSPERTWSVGEAVRLHDIPMTEDKIGQVTSTDSPHNAQRYTLSDEQATAENKQDEQVRSTPIATSSVGISRSKRMGKTRTSSSSSVASRRSLASVGAGLRRSSRTSVHEQTPSSPTPLPELEEDASVYDGIVVEPKRPSSAMTYTFDPRNVYAESDYEDGTGSNKTPARASFDSYISAADQYVGSSNSHHNHAS